MLFFGCFTILKQVPSYPFFHRHGGEKMMTEFVIVDLSFNLLNIIIYQKMLFITSELASES